MPLPRSTAIEFLRHCHAAAIRAVQAAVAMRHVPFPPASGGAPWIIAIGKAADGMAAAVAARLAERGTPVAGGIVIGADGGGEVPPPLQSLQGDHPMPGARSFAAAAALASLVDELPADAEVHVAISGGASALIAAPRAGVTEAELVATFDALHRAGTPIAEMNRARRRVARWSGGRLAEALAPRPVHCWLISDVPDDDPRTIGSGPCHGEVPAPHVHTTLLATNRDARRAAAAAAAALGAVQRVADTTVEGEARDVGRRLAIEAMRAAEEWHRQSDALFEDGHGDAIRPLLLVWGGETTVTLGNADGRGGRAQELALAAAEMLEVSRHPVTLLSAGSDGRDGPTDAAGAIVDESSWGKMQLGGDPAAALDGHDAYPALERIDALLRTGPTGTNVMDLVLAVVGWDEVSRRGGA